MKKDVYQIVSDRILALLDAGVNPWRKPWSAAAWKPPRNLASGKAYRGINVMLLGMAPYESNYWLTFKQALDRGGNVRKGEKSSLAVFWKLYDRKAEDGATNSERKQIPVLRYYNVFNSEQCEGIETPPVPVPQTFEHDPIETAERLAAGMPQSPEIIHDDRRRAFYREHTDTVNMPLPEQFQKREEYYSTLFHELAHSTGHKSRLNRDLTGQFGDRSYGREELIAEMAAAYLCGLAGILDETVDNTAAYLDSWRGIIKEDKKAVVMAAAAAQKAVDFITAAEQAEQEEAA